MKYVVETASGGMMYKSSFTTAGSGIQVILKLLSQRFERLDYWYYTMKRFMKYAIEMTSGDMIYLPSCMTIGSGVQKLLGGYIYALTHSCNKVII
jgi:hypothetical protein